MDEAINKFLLEIAKESERVVDESILMYFNPTKGDTKRLHERELRMREIHNFTKMLTVNIDYPENHGEVFNDFNILCEYLDKFDLNYMDIYYVLLYFIEKNVHSGILNTESLLVDLKSIDASGYSEEVIEFVKYLIVEDKIQEFMNIPVYITDKEIKAEQLIRSFSIDLEPYYTLTKTINDSFISKMDSYDEEDIKKIDDYLIQSGVSDKSRICFMKAVRKNLSKRVSVPRVTQGLYQVVSSESMTQQEYKKLEKEIRKIYNFRKRELAVPISYLEMINLAKKMVEAKYSEEEIIEFFKIAMNESNRTNDISEFVEYYEKYKYYLDQDSIEMIESCLKEMVICNDEDYIFWKDEVKSLIQSASHQFEKRYDYELELVKR